MVYNYSLSYLHILNMFLSTILLICPNICLNKEVHSSISVDTNHIFESYLSIFNRVTLTIREISLVFST